MRRIRNTLLAAMIVVGLWGGAAAFGGASDSDDDRPVSGSALALAATAALRQTGGPERGRVIP